MSYYKELPPLSETNTHKMSEWLPLHEQSKAKELELAHWLYSEAWEVAHFYDLDRKNVRVLVFGERSAQGLTRASRWFMYFSKEEVRSGFTVLKEDSYTRPPFGLSFLLEELKPGKGCDARKVPTYKADTHPELAGRYIVPAGRIAQYDNGETYRHQRNRMLRCRRCNFLRFHTELKAERGCTSCDKADATLRAHRALRELQESK